MSSTDPVGPTSHIFISQRLRLHYVDWGNPTAPPLLLLHGGRDHCRSWDWTAKSLRNDWHVIAPDLRGHGDSAWSPDGDYTAAAYVYDLAQLIHQENLAPLTIVAHSLGGSIALRYSGLYPENVRKLVAIEGLGPSPRMVAERRKVSRSKRWRDWIEERRSISGRLPRRYATFEDALARMKAENGHLSEAQAQHLTAHAVSRNEDGTWSWKFDNYIRSSPPSDDTEIDLQGLWAAITCPTLLVYGRESWASNPTHDGRGAHFQNAQVVTFDDAAHWVHHDRFDAFVARLQDFL